MNLEKFKSLRGILYRKVTEKALEQEKIEQALPGFSIKKPERIVEFPSTDDLSKINVTYPLIEPFTYANIKWDQNTKELFYYVIQPELDEKEKELLAKISDGLIELVEVELSAVKEISKAIDYLRKNVMKVIKEFGIKLDGNQFIKIMYYIYRNFVGMNEIEPFLQDPNIEDISCDGVSTPMYVIHRRYGSLKTNVVFTDMEKLRQFVIKLAERSGRYVSYAEPILSGTLPDGSRVSATLAGDVATHGPTFTIRKFSEHPFSPVDQMDLNTADSEILAYFWYLMQHGVSLLIVGGVATGKTSLLNTISMFIPPEAKIVSIEDTRELRLPHEHWIPSLARVGFGIPTPTGEKYGGVSLFDLLKESFRQNPDYVIVGEVRGKETSVMFQGMSSIPSWENIVVLNDNHWRKLPIGDVVNKDIRTFSVDLKTKNVNISPVRAKYEHKPRKLLYKIETNTGREVFISPDHSVFTFNEEIRPVRAIDLEVGSKIVIPARLPCGFNDIKYLNLTELFPEIRMFSPSDVKKAVKSLGFYKASRIVGVKSISDYYANFKRSKPSSLFASRFFRLMKEANIEVNLDNLKVKFRNKSKILPAKLKLTNELLRLLGYYVSEGSLNESGTNRRINFYNQDERVLNDIRNCLKKVAKIKPKERKITRGFGWAKELSFNHRILFELFKKFCGKNLNERKIPEFIFGLNKEKIAHFISGLYAGDGWLTKVSKNSYLCGYSTQSRKLADDLLYLLLTFGIVAKVRNRTLGKKNRGFEIKFNRTEEIREFFNYAHPVNMRKMILGKGKRNELKINDIYIDKIKDIKKIELKKPEVVYDLSIMGKQNFIGGFGGVLLHNSGHPSISTFHAGSVDTMIKRLITPPIELSPTLIESLDVIGVMIHAREKGKSARRMKEIIEIESVDPKTNEVKTRNIYSWDPVSDKYVKVGESMKVAKVALARGTTVEEAFQEIAKRKKVLEWMRVKQIKDFNEVNKIINMYYKEPEKLLKVMEQTKESFEEVEIPGIETKPIVSPEQIAGMEAEPEIDEEEKAVHVDIEHMEPQVAVTIPTKGVKIIEEIEKRLKKEEIEPEVTEPIVPVIAVQEPIVVPQPTTIPEQTPVPEPQVSEPIAVEVPSPRRKKLGERVTILSLFNHKIISEMNEY